MVELEITNLSRIFLKLRGFVERFNEKKIKYKAIINLYIRAQNNIIKRAVVQILS